ncbi:MAG TPA: carboxymuconolactone decarboxylase family protein [Acidimicrobiales bacterium]
MTDSPRIAPLSPDEVPDDLAEFVTMNIFGTLANHPGLMRKWLPFGGKLLAGGTLDPRTRELLILRTAWNVGSDYEWGQHLRIGRQAGLTDEEMDRVTAGPDAAGWSDDDGVVLRACDELCADRDLTDPTWAALAARFDTKQLIEVTMLVGHYVMVAGMLRSLRVQRDPGVEGFPRVP